MARLATLQPKTVGRRAERVPAPVVRPQATADRSPLPDLRQVPLLPPTVQRNVAGTTVCAANTHGAPADPIAHLTAVDAMAQDMALAASHLLFLEALTFADPTFGPSAVHAAYRRWFGGPTAMANGRWRSRFRSASFDTEALAERHEMETLATRFRQLSQWLGRDIRYRCTGAGSFTIPGCGAASCGTRAAQACTGGARVIRICPPFWTEPAPQDRAQAALLIHEAVHARFGFRLHGTATAAGRGRNPGCYQGFVLDVFGTGVTPGDCTAI